MKKLSKSVKILSGLLLINSFLIGCVNTSSSSCPTPKFYRDEIQEEVDKALKRADEPVLYDFISDYGDLREKLRVE